MKTAAKILEKNNHLVSKGYIILTTESPDQLVIRNLQTRVATRPMSLEKTDRILKALFPIM